ncbi:MAG: hypothetical protein JST61_11285 [Acidobacteria bacterium]|nr:hypothetical protein [Acidobacteriota bacterium]
MVVEQQIPSLRYGMTNMGRCGMALDMHMPPLRTFVRHLDLIFVIPQ